MRLESEGGGADTQERLPQSITYTFMSWLTQCDDVPSVLTQSAPGPCAGNVWHHHGGQRPGDGQPPPVGQAQAPREQLPPRCARRDAHGRRINVLPTRPRRRRGRCTALCCERTNESHCCILTSDSVLPTMPAPPPAR